VVLANDVLQPVPHVELGLEGLVLLDHAALVEGPLDGHGQLFVDERLGEEVEGPGADRLDGGIDRAVAGDHDHSRGRLVLAAEGQHVEPVPIAQPDVHQDDVVGLAPDRGEGLGAAGGRVQLVPLLPQPIGHRLEQVPVVVD